MMRNMFYHYCHASTLVRQHKVISNSLTKIVMVNTKFILGINVLLQSDLWNEVKGQTKIGRKTNKRTGTDKEIYNKYLHSFVHEVVHK